MIRRAVVLLPQPVSPTIPSVSPRLHLEADAVDGLHGADLCLMRIPLRDREVLDEVADLDQRVAAGSPGDLRAAARAAPPPCSTPAAAARLLGRAAGASQLRPMPRCALARGSSRQAARVVGLARHRLERAGRSRDGTGWA